MSESNSDSSILNVGSNFFAKRSIHSYNSDPSSSSQNPMIQAAKNQWHAIMSLENSSDEDQIRRFYTFQLNQNNHSTELSRVIPAQPTISAPVTKDLDQQVLYRDETIMIDKELLLYHLSTRNHTYGYSATINGILKALSLIWFLKTGKNIFYQTQLHTLMKQQFQLPVAQPNLRKERIFNFNQILIMTKSGKRLSKTLVRKVRVDTLFIHQQGQSKKIPLSFDRIIIDRKTPKPNPSWVVGRNYEIFDYRVVIDCSSRTYSLYTESYEQSMQLRDFLITHNNTILFKKRVIETCANLYNSLQTTKVAKWFLGLIPKPKNHPFMQFLQPPSRTKLSLPIPDEKNFKPLILDVPNQNQILEQKIGIDQKIRLEFPFQSVQQSISRPPVNISIKTQQNEELQLCRTMTQDYLNFLYNSTRRLEKFMSERLRNEQEMLLRQEIFESSIRNQHINTISLKGELQEQSKIIADDSLEEQISDEDMKSVVESEGRELESIQAIQPGQSNSFSSQQTIKQLKIDLQKIDLEPALIEQKQEELPQQKHLTKFRDQLENWRMTPCGISVNRGQTENSNPIQKELDLRPKTKTFSNPSAYIKDMKPSNVNISMTKTLRNEMGKRQYVQIYAQGEGALSILFFDTSIQQNVGKFRIGRVIPEEQSVQVNFSTREVKSLIIMRHQKQIFRQDFKSFAYNQLIILIL